MHEVVILILTQVRMAWRFRWLALGVATIVCVCGWIAVVALPNQFEARAKVYLDTSSMLRPLLRGLAADNQSQIRSTNMVRRTLLVRPNLESVARKTDMDLRAKTPEAFERLLNHLRRAIRIRGSTRSNIFVIGYANKDPQLATRVVEAILNMFVERSLGDSRKDAGKTKQFLDRQVAEYESRLAASEKRIKDFKRNNAGLNPGSAAGTYFKRLGSAQAALEKAKLALEESTRRREEYRRQLDGVDTLFEPVIVASGRARAARHPLDGRINGLEKQLDQLLLRYTEQHPDVTSARSMLEGLVKKREDTPVPVRESVARPAGEAGNPMQQQLSIALGRAEAEAAGLAARVQEFERRVQKLQDRVDTVPRIETELKRLDRDYANNKRTYEEFVKRRESLSLSEQANQSTEAVQFNIIEPPRVPLIPTGPNRKLFSGMVLATGLGGGLGLAWLVAFLRPAVYRREEVETAFNLPVIGTVSRSWTRGEVLRRRMEVSTFVIGCVLLVGLYSGVLVLEAQHRDLMEQVRAGEFSAKVGNLVARYL